MNTTDTLKAIAEILVNQNNAEVVIPAEKPESGYWFGGGNMIADEKGNLYISGRYRNSGDSRTGIDKGERGKELAVFRSPDGGRSFEKIISFDKTDLKVNGWEILSIEGSALNRIPGGVELYVSTEKIGRPFAEGYSEYHKEGTGSWTIEKISASSVEELPPGESETVIDCRDPRWFNVKDPFIYHNAGEELILGFCSHPFNWASSNSGFARFTPGKKKHTTVNYEFFPRGFCWDVGISRATCFIDLPRAGKLSGEQYSLCFYDGGEAMRDYPQHNKGLSRPRGYSCEELGGAGYFTEGNPETIKRLSIAEPMLLSPYGTGSSRYVDVLETDEEYLVTWQQSQADGSQPLVMNRVERKAILEIVES
jgi:hypothetical protein